MRSFKLTKLTFICIVLFTLAITPHIVYAQYRGLSIAPAEPIPGDTNINGYVNAYFYKDFENYRNSYGIEFYLKNDGRIIYRKLINWNPYRQEYSEVEQTIYGSYHINRGNISIRWENGITDTGTVSSINGGRIKINFDSSNKRLKGTYAEKR